MPRRDRIGRGIALAVGAAVGLRALQVVRNFNETGGYSSIAANGTVVGLVVTVVVVVGLAAWLFDRRPDGAGGPRLVALAAGMILGGVVGAIAFGAG